MAIYDAAEKPLFYLAAPIGAARSASSLLLDPGEYRVEFGSADAAADSIAFALTGDTIVNRPARILQPGMVLTIEPGIYVRPAAGVPEAFHNIGIRIEDDAIVTASGCELISRGVPVAADEIEALMRG